MIRILSIDFDYFQNVSADTLADYPDGVDLSPQISSACWSSHYANTQIGNVTINEDELNALMRLIERQKSVKECMIACSHKSIYDFVKDDAKRNNVSLYNIDMHHDMFNKNDTVDCGNWIGHLKKLTKNCEIKWVCNPVSEEVYGLDKRFQPLLLHSVTEITENRFDYIFLCRSDSWLPPHLDAKFDNLSDFLIQTLHCPIQYETRLDFDRYEACMDMKKEMEAFLNEIER